MEFEMPPLLTIAIPTYNRCKYLQRCLEYISGQLSEISYKLEIIVSDNASKDDTEKVVEHFSKNGMPIRYIKNIENRGPDFNILQCYMEARGKYVLVFGDDDIILPGTLNKIKSLLSDDFGVIFLNGTDIKKHTAQNPSKPNALKYKIYDNKLKFYNKINYYITFISANIIRKEYYQACREHDEKSNLVQVPLILKCVERASRNVYVKSCSLGVENNDTVSYNLFKVFGTNLHGIVESEIKSKLHKDVIYFHLLLGFFPFWINRLKMGLKLNSSGSNGSPYLQLKNIFGKNIFFWISVFPVFKLPRYITSIYIFFLKGFRRVSFFLIENI